MPQVWPGKKELKSEMCTFKGLKLHMSKKNCGEKKLRCKVFVRNVNTLGVYERIQSKKKA